jgi:hypothetical protein
MNCDNHLYLHHGFHENYLYHVHEGHQSHGLVMMDAFSIID